jgi:hypothetical protein
VVVDNVTITAVSDSGTRRANRGVDHASERFVVAAPANLSQ